MTTGRLSLQQPGVKDRIKRYIPCRLWKALRRGKNCSTEFLARILIGAMLRVNGPAETLCLLYDGLDFTPETVVRGYLQGMFPSAIHASGVIRWHDPDPRGIMPIHGYHVEKEMQRIIRQNRFEIRVDHDLRGVMKGCAEPKPGREDSWIVPERIEVYSQLQKMGIAHSVEAYQNGVLVGGLYGVTLGAYFSGESQFHTIRNAGKVAFVYLLMILERGGFLLHDTWWGSKHLEQFGGTYIPREEFKRLQARALLTPATFAPLDEPPTFS